MQHHDESLCSLILQAGEHGPVAKAQSWESGLLGNVPGSANALLCGIGQFLSLLLQLSYLSDGDGGSQANPPGG